MIRSDAKEIARGLSDVQKWALGQVCSLVGGAAARGSKLDDAVRSLPPALVRDDNVGRGSLHWSNWKPTPLGRAVATALRESRDG